MKKRVWLNILFGLTMLAVFPVLASAAVPWQVTSNLDSGTGSLREMIAASNTTTGVQTITFAVSNSITVHSDLDIQSEVVIEGNGTTIGALNVSAVLYITTSQADHTVIRDLAIVSAGTGIMVNGPRGIRVLGCMIGTDWTSATGRDTQYGVYLANSGENQIGGREPGERNVISGNSSAGIYMTSDIGTRIQGNYIGTQRNGSNPLPNNVGIYLAGGAVGTLIGGDRLLGEGNVISGNSISGMNISATGNSVCGNIIGLNSSGNAALSNTIGIRVLNTENYIGGRTNTATAYGNIISGNSDVGISVEGAQGNSIMGNWIGLGASGQTSNTNPIGIRVSGGSEANWIGFSGDYRNVIIGTTDAVLLTSTNWQNVSSNYIGINSLGNQVTSGIGVHVINSSYSEIVANYICGTGAETILLDTSSFNRFYRNWINILPDGRQAVVPAVAMRLTNANDNSIGAVDSGNLIAGSPVGIRLDDSACIQNAIIANTICAFTNAGIQMASGANHNMAAPVISLAENDLVAGTAPADSYVQLFKAENRPGGVGGSLQYIDQLTATSSGFWSIHLPGYYDGYLCAQAYDPGTGDSSNFSLNVLSNWTAPTASPTPTTAATPGPQNTATPTPTATQGNPLDKVDMTGRLVLAFPNPAKDQVRFLLSPDRPIRLKIIIMNLAGERVALVEDILRAGRGTVAWDCRGAAAGVYMAMVFIEGKETAKLKIAVLE